MKERSQTPKELSSSLSLRNGVPKIEYFWGEGEGWGEGMEHAAHRNRLRLTLALNSARPASHTASLIASKFSGTSRALVSMLTSFPK